MRAHKHRSILMTGLCAALIAPGLSAETDTPAADSPAPASLELEIHAFTARVGHPSDPFEENVYLLTDAGSKQCLIIDPGARCPELEGFISASNLTVVGILNTHGHGDHKGGNGFYRKRYQTEVIAHAEEKSYYGPDDNRPTKWISGDSVLKAGVFSLQVLHTPGHTPGSTCYLIQDHLFSGDTLFEGTIGRTSNEAVQKEMVEHIRKKLLVLPPETIVYPGHDDKTTIGAEQRNNPYL